MRLSRRQILRMLGGTAVAAPFAQFLGTPAYALSGRCERVIFLYYPDGVAGPSSDGQPSAWHPYGSEFDVQLTDHLSPLERWKSECLFFRGLSMGATDAGSHPGGARKLLTAADHGGGESIDQFLSRTAGGSSPWRHLYLGAMANHNGASGDKHIVHPSAGVSIPPQDNPREAFESLFGGFSSTPSGEPVPVDHRKRSLLDAMTADLGELRAKLGSVEKTRLDIHLESIREVERRVGGGEVVALPEASCSEPRLDTGGFTDGQLYEPERFPAILKAQMDLMVLAMSCGLTRVGTIQASHHTSELIMSRFPGTEMHDPGYDMRSHQASHYGSRHDLGHREFRDFVAQRRWFAAQYAYLLEQLASRPEGDGTMLDHSLVVLVTEVCDGNTHSHDDMPIVVAGRGGGKVNPGRLLDVGYERHGRLWISIAHAMEQYIDAFGDASYGALPRVLA